MALHSQAYRSTVHGGIYQYDPIRHYVNISHLAAG